MLKLYKALDDINIYIYQNGEYITSFGKKIVKDSLIFIEDNNNNNYLNIKVFYSYVQNFNIKRVKKEKRTSIPVLMYHFFYDKTNNEEKTNHNYIEKKTFYKQMKFLSDNKYNSITPNELEKYIDGKEKIPEKTIMITIDDGAISQYKYAFPILKHFNLKASFAIINSTTGQNDKTGWHLTKDMYNEMNESGIITFYSHSHDMHKLENDIFIFLSKEEDKS